MRNNKLTEAGFEVNERDDNWRPFIDEFRTWLIQKAA